MLLTVDSRRRAPSNDRGAQPWPRTNIWWLDSFVTAPERTTGLPWPQKGARQPRNSRCFSKFFRVGSRRLFGGMRPQTLLKSGKRRPDGSHGPTLTMHTISAPATIVTEVCCCTHSKGRLPHEPSSRCHQNQPLRRFILQTVVFLQYPFVAIAERSTTERTPSFCPESTTVASCPGSSAA